jgi:hypothetical protein
MADESRAKDPGAAWRDQPEEKTTVDLSQFMNRRVHELYWSTRAEILLSIGAAAFFVAVTAWRLAPIRDPIQQLGFAVVVAWVLTSLWWFRRRIWRPEPAPPKALAASGVEYYRKELERRRDHLRNAWIWHGPLLLACMIFGISFFGKAFPSPDRLRSLLPLVLALLVWTAIGLWRRRRLAQQIQREIDEIGQL